MAPDPADAPATVPEQAAERCGRLLGRLRQDRASLDAPPGPGAPASADLAEGRIALDRAAAAAARLAAALGTPRPESAARLHPERPS